MNYTLTVQYDQLIRQYNSKEQTSSISWKYTPHNIHNIYISNNILFALC